MVDLVLCMACVTGELNGRLCSVHGHVSQGT